MSTTAEDVIRAAATVGRDVAEGKLSPAALDAAVAEECRSLFGQVVGPADPLWALQTDVARQALALGALTADELNEWAAVMRRRAGEDTETPEPSTDPLGEDSPASGPHSPETEVTDEGDDLDEV